MPQDEDLLMAAGESQTMLGLTTPLVRCGQHRHPHASQLVGVEIKVTAFPCAVSALTDFRRSGERPATQPTDFPQNLGGSSQIVLRGRAHTQVLEQRTADSHPNETAVRAPLLFVMEKREFGKRLANR
jgi:hypothetical protein